MTPGYKTTEFWLSIVAVIVGAISASGAIAADSPTMGIIGVVASALVALGYTGARTNLKKAGDPPAPPA